MRTKPIAALVMPCALMLAGCSQTVAAGNEAKAAVAPTADRAVADAEVRKFVADYNGYYAANDMDRYFASFASDLTQWWPSGRVDLATYERDWRRGVAAGGGVTKVEVKDLQVQVDPSGDASVATYVLEVTPRRKGKPVDRIERYQETDVLFKRDGAWTIVHVNYGPAAPAKPAAS